MGDVVHALPLAVDIAHALPDAQIDWLCEEAFAAIPAMSRHVGDVHRVALRRWRKRPFDPAVWREVRIAKSALRDAHYDLVLDVQGLAKSAWLARWTGCAGHRLRFVDRARRYRRALLSTLASKCRAACMPSSVAGASAQRRSVMRSPARRASASHRTLNRNRTTTSKWQCCSSTRAAQPSCGTRSAGLRSSAGWRIRASRAFCSADRRKSDCAASRSQLKCSVPKSVRRRRSRRSRPALATASIVIGLDTGLTHLAAALGRPTVGIFCDYDPALVGLTGDADAANAVVSVGSATAAPAASEVIDAAARVLNRRP